MKRRIISFFSTVYSQIILIFLVMVILLLLGGMLMANQTQRLAMEQISISALDKAEYFMNVLQRDLSNILALQYACTNNIDFNKFALPEFISKDYQRYSIHMNVRQQLELISSVSNLTEYASAYFVNTKQLVTAPSMNADKANYEVELLSNLQHDSALAVVDGTLRTFLVYPGLPQNDKETMFIISVKLSNQSIAKSLLEVARSENENVLLLHDSGWHLDALGLPVEEEEYRLLAQGISDTPSGVQQYAFGNEDYMMSWYSIKPYGLKMVVFNDMQQSQRYTTRFQIFLLIFVAVSLLLTSAFVLLAQRIIQRPMGILVSAFDRMQNKDLKYRITAPAPNEFSYIYESYNKMAENIDDMIETVYEAKILAQESEFKHLQSQISPHFLYNCFFLLSGQIQIGDQETASAMARKLGNYFKFVTYNNQATISLADEYKHAITYSEIQILRFGVRVSIQCQPLPKALGNIQVPRIIIQPLIENAFEHGVRECEAGFIRLSAGHVDGVLRIAVEDNGNALGEEQLCRLRRYLAGEPGLGSSTAIANISKRLQILYQGKAGLVAERSTLGGMKMTIWMEMEEAADVQDTDCGR